MKNYYAKNRTNCGDSQKKNAVDKSMLTKIHIKERERRNRLNILKAYRH